MFFIIGIFPQHKTLDFQQVAHCPTCHRLIKLKIVQSCSCFSCFFIPILKWNRTYHIECEECHSLYALNYEVGTRIRNGETVLIQDEDLQLIHKENYKISCPVCGSSVDSNFDFCPKCGNKLNQG